MRQLVEAVVHGASDQDTSERLSEAAARAQQARLLAEQARTTASLAHVYLSDTQERLADHARELYQQALAEQTEPAGEHSPERRSGDAADRPVG